MVYDVNPSVATPRHVFRSVGGTALALATLLAFAACSDSTSPEPPDLWEAEIAGKGEYVEIEGTAEVESTTTTSTAQIEISGAPAEATFAWRVAEGTCTEPGEIVGAAGNYPALETDEDGEASATANVAAPLVRAGEYHVAVHVEENEGLVLVACGELERGD